MYVTYISQNNGKIMKKILQIILDRI